MDHEVQSASEPDAEGRLGAADDAFAEIIGADRIMACNSQPSCAGGAASVDFAGEDLLIGDAAIQSLGREHAEFGFGHVEPTAVLGRVGSGSVWTAGSADWHLASCRVEV